MPYYEYRCGSNGRTIEVRHSMDERIQSWNELTERAGLEPDGTPPDAPVERLLSTPVPLSGSRGDQDFQGCGSACGCVPQA